MAKGKKNHTSYLQRGKDKSYSDFFSETIQAKGEQTEIFKVLREKNKTTHNSDLEKYPSKVKENT